MGFLDNLKSAAESVKASIEGAVDAAEGRALAESSHDGPIVIINPTPQQQIDAGAQRGVIRSVSYDMGEDDWVMRMRVHVYVHARLAGGELGPETELTIWSSSSFAKKLKHGMEIPLEFDPATGIPTKLDAKAIAAELK